MKKYIFGRNDVEARASVRTPSYAPVYVEIQKQTSTNIKRGFFLNVNTILNQI